eukprot:TRINITY_DN23991_c0_g1_i1.p1 TRINITY_DN23991_c0_g1~~TRINITY_DN23991_c0_g1_i1.p1  ORF type:complete len:582 (+),score=104.09 TRINITY_DN23991_c0_g1_i1:72-1817(+)
MDSDLDGRPPRGVLPRRFLDQLKELMGFSGETGIWDVVGNEDDIEMKIIRFGSKIDFGFFKVLRIIAFVDIVWVPFLLSFAKISYVNTTIIEGPALIIDALLSTVYALGVLLRIRTSIVELVTGREYIEPVEIVLHQIMTPTFWIDATSLLGALWYVRGPRALAAVRILRSWRLSSTADDLYELHMARLGSDQPFVSLLVLVFNIGIVVHIFACSWFGAMTFGVPGWEAQLYKDERFWGGSLANVYLVYFADGAAMLVGWTGPPSSSPDGTYTRTELVVWSVLAPLAAICNGMVFAQLLDVVNQASNSTAKHIDKMADCDSVCSSLQVPPVLKHRCLKYMTFLSVNSASSADYDDLFKSLSVDLQEEITLHLFHQLVEKAPFFRDIEEGVIKQIVLAFEQEVHGPGQAIFRKGEMGQELFFIIKGIAQVVIDGGVVVGLKRAGEHFGEIALIYHQPRSATVLAKTFCIVAKLTREAFTDIMDKSPHARETVFNHIKTHAKIVGAPPPPNDSNGPAETVPLLTAAREQSRPVVIEDTPLQHLFEAVGEVKKRMGNLDNEMLEMQKRLKTVDVLINAMRSRNG